jgi:ATP-dependent Clp protease, protease subunit
MASGANPPKPPTPEKVYGVFCGDINAVNTPKLINNLTVASNLGVKQIHILFQSWGGFVGDGIFLFNFLRSFPIEITLYNAGQVASAGVLAFMGARYRKTTKNAIFMIHKTINMVQSPTSLLKLQGLQKSLILDDDRVETLFRDSMQLPDEIWDALAHHDINISGEDAIQYGIAQEIGEFSPPSDSKVFNALT